MLAKNKSPRLPVQPTGTSELLTKLSEADLSIGDIVELVERSPAIAARLIATANSAWSNPVSPVTSVEQACARLGLAVVRTTTVALAVGSIFDTRACPEFEPERFWATSILSGKIAHALAAGAQRDPKTAQTAGLIANVGLLWLADSNPHQTGLALRQASQDNTSLGACLQQHCGVHHKQASYELFLAWRFPAVLMAGLGRSPNEDDTVMAGVVSLASDLASNVFEGIELADSDCPEGDEAAAEAYNAERAGLAKTMRQVSAILA